MPQGHFDASKCPFFIFLESLSCRLLEREIRVCFGSITWLELRYKAPPAIHDELLFSHTKKNYMENHTRSQIENHCFPPTPFLFDRPDRRKDKKKKTDSEKRKEENTPPIPGPFPLESHSANSQGVVGQGLHSPFLISYKKHTEEKTMIFTWIVIYPWSSPTMESHCVNSHGVAGQGVRILHSSSHTPGEASATKTEHVMQHNQLPPFFPHSPCNIKPIRRNNPILHFSSHVPRSNQRESGTAERKITTTKRHAVSVSVDRIKRQWTGIEAVSVSAESTKREWTGIEAQQIQTNPEIPTKASF